MQTDDNLAVHPSGRDGLAGKVNFGFSYPSHGWIQCTITCTTNLQGVILHFSNAFDPFPAMFHWLEAIAENNLPFEFLVDEEGPEKVLAPRQSMKKNSDWRSWSGHLVQS